MTNLDQQVLDSVCALTGIQLVAGSRLSAGESEVWCTQADDGSRFALRLHRTAEHLERFSAAERVTNQLRKSGYPAPKHIGSGYCQSGSWQLIKWAPGHSHQRLTKTTLQQLLSLVAKQRTLATESFCWTSEIANSVLSGCDGYCELTSLQSYSGRSEELLNTIQQWAKVARNLASRCEDIVHFDFHPGNILVDEEHVCAVIDWDGTRHGDATFDLVTLLYYCFDDPSTPSIIRAEIENLIPLELFRLYMAHMILRQVDWSLRHHDQSTIDYYLNRSERIVDDLQTR